MFSNFHLFKKREKPAPNIQTRDTHTKTLRDWKILLLAGVVLGIVIVALDAYLLWRVNSGDIFTVSTPSDDDTIVIDQKTLSRVVKSFEDRAASFEEFKKSPRVEIDPSL